MFVLGRVELTPLCSHPATFVELLGCGPRDYTPLTITETWLRRLPIYEIYRVRLCPLRRCFQWGLLYQAGISGSCWIDRLRRTWVVQVEKSGQQMVPFPGPLDLIKEMLWHRTKEEIKDWLEAKMLMFMQEEADERRASTRKWIGILS